jgi:hypothetical protein
MRRSTGGNRILAADSGIEEIPLSVKRQLAEIRDYDPERDIDFGTVVVETRRVKSGLLSVSVEADLLPSTEERA